jgi:1,4-dihydroxy-2-naphthoate octaprenyltransferase
MGLKRVGRLRAFLRLSRPQFLVPGLALYVLGAFLAFAYGAPVDAWRFVGGYLIFFFAHFSLTFSNDYFDRRADSFSTPTPLSGGSGALRSHPELARLALWLSLTLIGASLLTAVAYRSHHDLSWYFLPLVLAGNLLGFFYTAPPLKLAYRGLGEPATILAAGFIMPAMGYLCMQGRLDLEFLTLVPALMGYGALFIISVEMPDREADERGGKRNMLVRAGLNRGLWAAMLASATASLYLLILVSISYGEVDLRALLVFSMLPLVAAIIGLRVHEDDRSGVIAQVKLNFAAIMGFVLLADAYLAWSLWAPVQ